MSPRWPDKVGIPLRRYLDGSWYRAVLVVVRLMIMLQSRFLVLRLMSKNLPEDLNSREMYLTAGVSFTSLTM